MRGWFSIHSETVNFQYPRTYGTSSAAVEHAQASATGLRQRRWCRRWRTPVRLRVLTHAGEQEVPQVTTMTTESGAGQQHLAAVHWYWALVGSQARLCCVDCHHVVGCDWAEQRCALCFAPIEPSSLTACVSEPCAAGHLIIDTTSRSAAGNLLSLEYTAANDFVGNGMVRAEARGEWQRSPMRW